MISSLLRSHRGFFPQGWQQFLEEHCGNMHGSCTAHQRREGGMSSAERTVAKEELICPILYRIIAPLHLAPSWKNSQAFLRFPFRCECLIAQHTSSLLTFLLSAPLCLLSRALLLPPDSQVFIRISSAPPHAPLSVYLKTFTIPVLSPLISTLLFNFSRSLAFLSNSSKASVVGSIIMKTATESWRWKTLLRTLVESLLLASFTPYWRKAV